MVSFPNSKINIGLNILRRREDGFHDIETVFFPLELSDILEFTVMPDTEYNGVRLTVSGLDIKCVPEKNLCVRAYELLKAGFDLPPLNVHLHKVIPSGAGLGGGSSDGAFMLKALSQEFRLGLTEEEICEYASRLGSDCAFFIKNKPLLAYGRGDRFREIKPFGEDFVVAVVHPGIHVSTAEAYAGVSPARPVERLEKLITLPVEEWKGRIVNDFETSIFDRYPLIGKIKEKLYSLGAVYASMSGSGSAVYGIFKNDAPDISGEFGGMFFWKGRGPSVQKIL